MKPHFLSVKRGMPYASRKKALLDVTNNLENRVLQFLGVCFTWLKTYQPKFNLVIKSLKNNVMQKRIGILTSPMDEKRSQ